MRIAFLCKRRYMGKDVIDDRYARRYEIPYQLARLGHQVHGFCLGYQGQPAGEWTHEASPGSLHEASLIQLGLILFFITFVVLAASKVQLARLERGEGGRT